MYVSFIPRKDSTVNKKIALFLSLPLLLLCLLLSGCNGSGDNSPDHYEPNGPAGNSSFDTTGMPVLSHTHELYEASRAEATCTAKGYIITACSVRNIIRFNENGRFRQSEKSCKLIECGGCLSASAH